MCDPKASEGLLPKSSIDPIRSYSEIEVVASTRHIDKHDGQSGVDETRLSGQKGAACTLPMNCPSKSQWCRGLY